MKTRLFKVFLISCVLFLGVKNAEAASKIITVNALPVADLYNISGAAALNSDQTNIALMGFQLKNTGGTSGTVTGFTLNGNGNNLLTYFPSGFKLYSYTSAVFPGTGTATLIQTYASPNATTSTVSLPAANNVTIASGATAPLYYFIVVNFTDNVVSSTTDDNQFSITSVTVSAGGFSTVTGNGPDYIISSPVTLGTATTTGLATSPLNADATGVGIMGFSITTTQSETFTQFNLTASQNTGNYFSNVKLYRSTTNNFAAAAQVTGITVSSLTSTTLTLSGFSQTIPTTTYYYFVVADFTAPTTGGTFRLSLNSAVAGSTYTNGATINGTNYTVSSPVTLGTASTTGLLTSPVSVTQTAAGILGFSVAVTGTKVITQVNLTASAAASYFTNYKLYSSTTNSFAAAALVAGSSVSGAGTTTLTASGFSKSVTNTTIYFFIVADFAPPGTSGSFQLTANSVVATSTYTNGAPISGTNYSVGPLTYNWVGGTATAGVYLWSTAANWSPASVPGPNDIAQIGITNYTSTHNPTVSTTASVGAINFGTNNGNNITLTANATLNIARDITVQSDDNSVNNQYVNIAGTGTVNVANVNVIANSDILADNFDIFDIYNEILNSSVTNFNISGNVNLTSIYDVFFIFLYNYSAAFYVTGGTTTISGTTSTAGIFQSTNETYANSYISVSNGNLILNNPNALNLLSSSGNNYVSFNNTGSLITYTGVSPTIYTNNAPNVNGGVSYKDITINGTGTATTESGTLTVSDNLTTSSATNFATNSTAVSVSNLWTNTANVTQGSGNITVSTQLIPNSNTITCGSGTLTAASMHFTGGNLTASSGTVTCSGTYTNDGGLFNCGTAANASVVFGGSYTNNSGTFTANPTSTSSVTFNGTNQIIQDNTTAGTTLNNVNFNGNNTAINVSTGAAGSGNFAVASTGILTMGSNAKLTAGSGSVGGAGYLTLMSSPTSTASVNVIPSTSSIVGAVNVQRSITGGTGTRGYRLLSSPVNISTNAAGGGNLSLAYLNTNASFGGITYPGAFTEGPGTGFTLNGSTNPIIYLYDESKTTNNIGYTTGKNIGIYSIVGNNVITLTGTIQAAASIPVGNGYLLYYVGNNTSTVVASTRVPDNTVITATGYLNQAQSTAVTVKFWNTSSTSIPYHTSTGSAYPGLNQVGNPFACTINLNTVWAQNTAVNPVFWELIPGGSYVSYSTATGHPVSDTRASAYIVSGQGFLVQAAGTGETLTFKEGAKVPTYPTGLVSPFNTTTSTALLMSLPSKPGLNTDVTAQSSISPQIASSPISASAIPDTAGLQSYLATRPSPSLVGLHLQITKDSLNYVQTGIYFSNTITDDKYSQKNDAISINGAGAQVFISSYSADNASLGINQLSPYTKGKRIKLYAAAASTGLYNISLADIANIDTGNYNIFLIDKKMNDSLDMVRYRSYAFNINNADTTTYGANRFVLAIERKALPPYQLVKFGGEKVTTGIQLTWQTINESDYTGFVLQKLISSSNYTMINTQQSNSGSNYSYIDKHPLNGNNTYRLQQTDIDGRITYSSPVTISYDSKSPNGSMTVYPNPSRSIITISLALNNTATGYVADIYNTSGTVISHQIVKANTWTQDIGAYKLGVYIIEVKTNSGDLIGKSKFVKIN